MMRSRRLVIVFDSVVKALMLPALNTRHIYFLCDCVGGQFIRDHHAWSDALLLGFCCSFEACSA